MTPDRIRGFLRRPAAGSTTLQLAADGLTGEVVVASWERKEVEEEEADDKRTDIASMIIAQAQEYCDAERAPIKFLIQWMSNRDKCITHATHRVLPSPEASEQDGPSASHVSDASIIKDLLVRLADKDKILNQMIGTSTTAYDKTIAMLTGQLESAYKQLNTRNETSSAPVVLTDEQREESIQRAKALGAFTDKVPDVIDLMLAALAEKFLPDAPDTSTKDDDDEKGATSH